MVVAGILDVARVEKVHLRMGQAAPGLGRHCWCCLASARRRSERTTTATRCSTKRRTSKLIEFDNDRHLGVFWVSCGAGL
ncbi:hypothetical protein B0T20DRAFT_398796 [Sordaria brevicollis]|uniref:Uncharacterized protein n=1 Tax=Sordaria brevicollis TaxID=83679 RepID=A0AAE0PMA1_SORBR|nr:hypothetical protein B0T20DRAFT_398796 [Sordaria brevicollis]